MWDHGATSESNRNLGQWSKYIDYLFYRVSGAAQGRKEDLTTYKHHEKIDLVHDLINHSKYLGDMQIEMSVVFAKQ